MNSCWENNTVKPSFNTLNEDKSTDVLIIGGGIAGILCAYKLKNAGINCILIEADKICEGITLFSTAKITFAHGLIYDKLIKKFGENKARLYLMAQQDACKEYEDLCKNIDCDYEIKDSFVYSLNNSKKIKEEIEALKTLGATAKFSLAKELPFNHSGAVCIENQAQFNPLKFLYSIAKDLPIYENTKAVSFAPHEVRTNSARIRFKKLIVATHFPIFNKHGLYSLKLYQHRSYVIALKGAQTLNGMYVDECDTGLSFRTYGDILLLGGGGHRTGKKGGCWNELEAFAIKYFKNAKIVNKWATQDCITLDGIPYIGQYSKSTPDVFVATGFNKWGITNSLVSANILCDLIKNKENPYAEVFSPFRSIFHLQLAANTLESSLGLLTPTAPRCPHLGCALKYNRAEHTWDCPCHGSRFTKDGKLINNPATDDHKSLGK